MCNEKRALHISPLSYQIAKGTRKSVILCLPNLEIADMINWKSHHVRLKLVEVYRSTKERIR